MAGSWRLRGHCAGCCDCRDWEFGFAAGWPKPASGDCAGYPPDRQPEGTSPLRRRGNVLAAIQQPSYMSAKADKRVFTPPAGTPGAAGVQAEKCKRRQAEKCKRRSASGEVQAETSFAFSCSIV